MIGVVLPPNGLGEPEVQCGDISVSSPNINACEEPPMKKWPCIVENRYFDVNVFMAILVPKWCPME